MTKKENSHKNDVLVHNKLRYLESQNPNYRKKLFFLSVNKMPKNTRQNYVQCTLDKNWLKTIVDKFYEVMQWYG